MIKKEEESGGGIREKNAASSGGGGGRYVDTSKALNPIWLMKCPPVVAQSLRALPSSSDPSLPGAKVIVSVDPLKPEDHPSEVVIASNSHHHRHFQSPCMRAYSLLRVKCVSFYSH